MSRKLLILLGILLLAGCSPPVVPEPGDPVVPPDAGEPAPPDAGEPPDAGPVDDCPEERDHVRVQDPRGVDSTCVFERWLAELPALAPAAQRARLEAYLLDDGLGSEVPLRTGSRVVFLAPIFGGVPAVAGDFNDWDPTRGAMTALAASGWAWREEQLEPGRHAYKFVYRFGAPDAEWKRDPGAGWVEPDGIDDGAIGAFNSVVIVGEPALDRGLVRVLPRVDSPELGNRRDVFVYLPPPAFEPEAALPSLYVNDGQEMLTKARLDERLDQIFSTVTARPAVVVLVGLSQQFERRDDYTFGTPTARGDAYTTFLAETLVPLVDAGFPTLRDRTMRGTAGASLGGLIAAYTAFQRPELFSFVGSQSGSFFWPEPDQEGFRALVLAADAKPIRFSLDNGTPGDNDRWNGRLATALRTKGYEIRHFEEAGARHDWPDWARRWPSMLSWLLPAR